MDLDAWINDPPSESEDESISTNSRYDNTGFYPGGSTENYVPEYQNTKKYVEPTTEELEKQRESRKQSEKINPFYIKDTKKPKLTQNVLIDFPFFLIYNSFLNCRLNHLRIIQMVTNAFHQIHQKEPFLVIYNYHFLINYIVNQKLMKKIDV